MKVRHPNGYESEYLHLSGITVRAGARIGQGDLVGRVGQTGLATGPHLHYEFRINDVHQNPLRIVMPPAPPISAELKPVFEAQIEPVMAQLKLLRSTHLAQLD